MLIIFIRLSPYFEIKNPHPQDTFPHPDISYAAAILEKDGHNIHLIDTTAKRYSLKEIIYEIDSNAPDVIFIHTMSPTAKIAIKIAKEIKLKFKNSVFLFGQHPSVSPETFLFKDSPVDLCIIGEPEITIKEIIQKIDKKDIFSIDGIAYFDKKIKFTKPRKLIRNLDDLPFPKHELFLNGNYKLSYPINLLRKIKWGFMETSRGCPYNCIYCSSTLRLSYGKNYRSSSPKKVVDEIKYLISKGINVVEFMDDSFTFDKNRITKICKEIIKRGLNFKFKWTAQTRADLVNKDILKIMKNAGCSTLRFGVESGSNRILKILKKDLIKERTKMVFDWCKELGILTVAYFMIGNPSETEEEIKETINFCKEIEPDMIQVAFFTPYPGSEFFRQISHSKKFDFENFSHYNEVVYNSSRISKRKLLKLQKDFYFNWFFSPNVFFRWIKREILQFMFNPIEKIDFWVRSFRFLLYG